jgi:predicted phosphodiesterase
VVRPHDRPIVLFGLDSNGYTEGNIAKGHVDYIKLGWLLDTIRKAESSGLTTPGGELSAEEFAVAPRCLLLHHHVLDVRSGALRDRHWARRALGHAASLLRTANPKPTFTVLDGAEDLLRAIRGRIDIVFHGHEHYATCFRDESGLVVISAGTASEWNDDGDRNSFYEVTIRDDQFVEIVEHSWDRNTATFRRVSPKSFPLERLRPRSKSPESLHRTD